MDKTDKYRNFLNLTLAKVTDLLLMHNNLLSICNKSVLQEEISLLANVTDQLLMHNNLLSICNKSVLQEEISLLARVTDQLLKSNSFSKSN